MLHWILLKAYAKNLRVPHLHTHASTTSSEAFCCCRYFCWSLSYSRTWLKLSVQCDKFFFFFTFFFVSDQFFIVLGQQVWSRHSSWQNHMCVLTLLHFANTLDRYGRCAPHNNRFVAYNFFPFFLLPLLSSACFPSPFFASQYANTNIIIIL